MNRKILIVLALVAGNTLLTGCGPLIIGAAAVVVADEVAERKNGGDGLF